MCDLFIYLFHFYFIPFFPQLCPASMLLVWRGELWPPAWGGLLHYGLIRLNRWHGDTFMQAHSFLFVLFFFHFRHGGQSVTHPLLFVFLAAVFGNSGEALCLAYQRWIFTKWLVTVGGNLNTKPFQRAKSRGWISPAFSQTQSRPSVTTSGYGKVCPHFY